MDILAVGNSFSRDATRYLHQIARADGVEMNVIGLAIGGCSLQQHYKHYMANDPLYELWVNGEYTEFFVTMKDALLNRDWDYITIHQNARLATIEESFIPYLEDMSAIFRKCCPKAKITVHEGWMSESHTPKLRKCGYEDNADMYKDLHSVNEKMSALIHADLVISCATVLNQALEKGLVGFYDDGHHASLGIGRYLMGLVWYKSFTGRSVTGNTFRDFDVPVSEDEVLFAQALVDKMIK
jgi:hypothetical protein